MKTKDTMSGLDAAAKVLSLATVPLNVQTIVERAIDKGLWKSKGKTPNATFCAAILREIGKKGKDSRFLKVARGLFTFNDEDHKKAAKEHVEAETKAKAAAKATKPAKVAKPKAAAPKAKAEKPAEPTRKAAPAKKAVPAAPKAAKPAEAPKAAPEAPKAAVTAVEAPVAAPVATAPAAPATTA